jgi:Aldehyde dehydrogenase family
VIGPTVFTNVRPGMRIAQAIRLANDVSYGLAATVWTSDLGRALGLTGGHRNDASSVGSQPEGARMTAASRTPGRGVRTPRQSTNYRGHDAPDRSSRATETRSASRRVDDEIDPFVF